MTTTQFVLIALGVLIAVLTVVSILFCGVAVFFNRGKPIALAAIVLVAFTIIFIDETRGSRIITQERSFFGVIRVLDDGTFHYLYHGTTLHGAQAMSPELQQTPLTYYFPTGPIGTVFSSIEPRRLRRVALVGLGAGSLLTYAKPEQQWTIYEIDPNVVSMAFDPKCFTYANNPRLSPPMVRLGDARLELSMRGHVGSFWGRLAIQKCVAG